MTVYNKEALEKLQILQKIEEWYVNKLLTSNQYQQAKKQYTSGLYIPNVFVKIGLYFLACLGMSTGFGILMLLLASSESSHYEIISIIYALICLVGLEFSIKNTNHYKSGIQQAFLYGLLGFLMPALYKLFGYDFQNSSSTLVISIIYLPILIAAMIRYIDRGVAFTLIGCIYTIYFLLIMKIGSIAKLIMPFAFIILSLIMYLWTIKAKKNEDFSYWNDCLVIFEISTLIMIYASGNYFTIRESGEHFFNMHLNKGEDIPLALVFYLFTALIPLAYVYFGLKKKDKILLWIGLLLIVLAVLTFKYYYGLHHPEYTLTIAGIIAIATASFSIKYLKTPKYGITFDQGYGEEELLGSNAEALIIAQSFTQTPHHKTIDFGGGSSGGAGATGNW